MKLVYTKWKDVKSFLSSIDKPVSMAFSIHISLRWLSGRLVYDVEIPREFIE